MDLIHHDISGTETDSVKPLSRKKLRQLMRHNHKNLGSATLRQRLGRVVGKKTWTELAQKREARKTKRKLFDKRSLPDGTTFQLMPNAVDLVDIKPTIFERLGGLFGGLRKKFERESAKKGK